MIDLLEQFLGGLPGGGRRRPPGLMQHPGQWQLDLAAILVKQPQAPVFLLQREGADEFALLNIFDNSTRQAMLTP